MLAKAMLPNVDTGALIANLSLSDREAGCYSFGLVGIEHACPECLAIYYCHGFLSGFDLGCISCIFERPSNRTHQCPL